MMKLGQLLLLATSAAPCVAFQPAFIPKIGSRTTLLRAEEGEWKGDVVNNDDGKIQGCTITPVTETDFTIEIDGVEADLGNFASVVYKKITSDAKKQSFQGFRPGTLPPNLLPAYKTFAMDEVAREAVLEAMQQNNIKPFESCRTEMEIGEVSIPPKQVKKKKKKKKSRKKGGGAATPEPEQEVVVEEPPAWVTYDTMKDAIKAGWEPGQSFSFVVTGCKGQKIEPVDMERKPVI